MASRHKETTNDDLARMIADGFDETSKRFDATAKKGDLTFFRNETKDNFQRVDRRLDAIERSLGHIENVVLDDHL